MNVLAEQPQPVCIFCLFTHYRIFLMYFLTAYPVQTRMCKNDLSLMIKRKDLLGIPVATVGERMCSV